MKGSSFVTKKLLIAYGKYISLSTQKTENLKSRERFALAGFLSWLCEGTDCLFEAGDAGDTAERPGLGGYATPSLVHSRQQVIDHIVTG